MTTLIAPIGGGVDMLPAPIALPYQQALATEHVQLRFRMLIKSFAGTLRYCTLLVLADYLRLRETKVIETAVLDRLLAERMERPSLGQWNELLRTVLGAFGDCSHLLFVPEIFDFYYKTPRSKEMGLRQQPICRVIDELVALRNKYVHPDIYPPDAEAQQASERSIELLNRLFDSLSFLRDYPLERVWEKDGATERCMGLMTSHTRRAAQLASFRVLGRDGTKALQLGHFVYYGSVADAGLPVLLYEAFIEPRVKYVLGNEYVILEQRSDAGTGDADPVRDLRALLSTLGRHIHEELSPVDPIADERSLPQAGSQKIEWDEFRQLTDTISEPVYNRFLKEGKYNGELYVPLRDVDEQVQHFLESTHRAAILVAESGFGKTSFLCHWYQRLRVESHAVVFLMGRTYGGAPIAQLILDQLRGLPLFGQVFKGDALDLLLQIGQQPRVRDDGRRVVVLVDAVNEAAEPEKMFDELCRFIRAANVPWLKVLLTIRTFAWSRVKDLHALDPSIYFGSEEKPGSGPHLDLPHLSPTELQVAFDGYSRTYELRTPYASLSEPARKLLSNPLLLRFAAEAYQKQSLPSSIFSDRIFEQFRQERVHKSDMYFLDYLAEAMWRMRRDYLLFADFDLNVAPGSETWLREPSVLHPTSDSIASKLVEYAFGDPVYEQSIIVRCENPACPSFHREVPPANLAGEGVAADMTCRTCRTSLSQLSVDMRTTYVRLCSENILQEFTVGRERVLRFTYDRWFEFLLGDVIAKLALGGRGAMPDAERFHAALTSVRSVFVFWGAFKNVLLDYLRRSPVEDPFWRGVLAHTPGPAADELGVQSADVAAVCRHILVSALIEFAGEDRSRMRAFLDALSDPERATPESLGVALEVALAITLDTEELEPRSSEIDVIRRGLRSPYPAGRSEACRVAFALAQRPGRGAGGALGAQELVLDLLDELAKDLMDRLSGLAVLRLASSAARDVFRARVTSLAVMSLHLLGSRFSDRSLRQRVLKGGIGLLSHLTTRPMLRLLKRPLAGAIAEKLGKAYWEKGPLPCNFIEMHLSLTPNLQSTATRIGELFKHAEGTLTNEQDLVRLCSTENGLIAWYMYSLLASHGHRPDNLQEILRLLQNIDSQGNHVARYVAVTALWILSDFSETAGAAAAPVYERVSRRFLEDSGGWITFRHDVALDSVIAKYLGERREDGSLRAYWASPLKTGGFECRYTNSVLTHFSEYKIRRHGATEVDGVVELLSLERWRGNSEMVAYCADVLSEIGERYPFPALSTFRTLVDRFVDYDAMVHSHGKMQSMRDVVASALMRIKSVHPIHVNHFIERLERRHSTALRDVQHATPEPVSESMDSYYGEVVYQKTFLELRDARVVFGEGMIDSARARTVNKFFLAYVRRIMARVAQEG